MFFIFFLKFLFYENPNANCSLRRQEFNLLKEHSDTINPENILGCDFGIESQPNHEEWSEFLQNNLQLDSAAVDTIPAGTFTVFANFVIDEKGKIAEISIIKDPGYGLADRVKKMISQYNGLWRPAQQNGRKIKSSSTQPITFVIEEETDNVCEDKQLPAVMP